MAVDLLTLATRADERSAEDHDYWANSAHFLRDVHRRGGQWKAGLSAKQQSWVSALRADLAEVGD